MTREQRRQRLVHQLKHPTPEMQKKLRFLKREGKARLKRGDFIWYCLLLSFSTWGNSRGRTGLIDDRRNYRRMRFPFLRRMSKRKCTKHIECVLRDAKVRRPVSKAELLSRNVQIIRNMGGLKKANRDALALNGTSAKIDFMKQFYGVGDKYARNIWMGVCDPDFHGSIAVDARIKSLSCFLGYSFASYAAQERFYQQIAEDAGREPWEVDRLVYNFKEELMEGIDRRRVHDPSNECRATRSGRSSESMSAGGCAGHRGDNRLRRSFFRRKARKP